MRWVNFLHPGGSPCRCGQAGRHRLQHAQSAPGSQANRPWCSGQGRFHVEHAQSENECQTCMRKFGSAQERDAFVAHHVRPSAAGSWGVVPGQDA